MTKQGRYKGFNSASEYKRYWYLMNREKRLEQEQARRNTVEWQVRVMYNRAKAKANRKGIEFTLARDDLVVPEYCPIFPWIKLTTVAGQGFVDSNISLDRKDPSKGYTKENVQIVSYKANRNKNNSTLKELVALGEWAKNVFNTNG